MGKLIFFLIIAAMIYYIYKKSKISKYINTSFKTDENNENEFIQCEKCKTFILKKEANKKNGKYYCKECNVNS